MLRAAIRLGETLDKVRQGSSSLVLPVMWIAMALMQVYVARDITRAAAWTVWVLLLDSLFLSEWYVGRRQEQHIAKLRAAATGDTADSGFRLGKRDRLWLAVIALGIVGCTIRLAAA